jgi:VIT1/CCC1 family predicted Fe2+/Mn2+ transporter
MLHEEQHRQHRVSWLRASVLGANDGIISTSSLIIGVVAANLAYQSILITALSAVSSAFSFTASASLPLSILLFARHENIALMVMLVTVLILGMLGAISRFLGGAKLYKGILRVTFWGAVAMTATFILGSGLNT